MPTPESLIVRAKSILGWGADNEDKYEEWRKLTQSNLRLNNIQGITRPGKEQFDAVVKLRSREKDSQTLVSNYCIPKQQVRG